MPFEHIPSSPDLVPSFSSTKEGAHIATLGAGGLLGGGGNNALLLQKPGVWILFAVSTDSTAVVHRLRGRFGTTNSIDASTGLHFMVPVKGLDTAAFSFRVNVDNQYLSLYNADTASLHIAVFRVEP